MFLKHGIIYIKPHKAKIGDKEHSGCFRIPLGKGMNLPHTRNKVRNMPHGTVQVKGSIIECTFALKIKLNGVLYQFDRTVCDRCATQHSFLLANIDFAGLASKGKHSFKNSLMRLPKRGRAK